MVKSTISSGENEPIWFYAQRPPDYASLREHVTTDVCIVGGGIAGLSVAYHLSREGFSVIVLEDGVLGSGETGRTTAHLSNAIDDRYTEIERIHGETRAKLAAESHTTAIRQIEQTVRHEHIDCDFTRLDGYLILSPAHSIDELEQEMAAARRAGLHNVTLQKSSPLVAPGQPCLRFAEQGQFHPLKYLTGLANAVVKNGGRIHTRTHVSAIESGSRAQIRTDSDFVVNAKSVIVATNTPINDLVTMHTKQAAYRTYAVGFKIPPGSVPRGLYWDTDDPYHYIRLQSHGETEDVLIVGGEDHKTGQADDALERPSRLAAWTRNWLPSLEAPAFTWSGQIMETIDGLAYIGRNPGDQPNVYIVTGDSGMGMTHGTIAGLLLTDLICGRENPWEDLYDPARIRVKAGSDLARENLNVAAQYRDWVTPGDVASPDEIPPGGGAVIRKGATKLAAYRDERGLLHTRSAVCPHLQCVVRWNPEEKTWDCPCHGSRFDCYGTVLNGPANTNLASG